MKDEKILKRIRNLLAMANDASSPAEAAIAARRVKSLLDKYELSENDIPTKDTVTFATSVLATGKKFRKWKVSMAINVAKYCDVIYKTDWSMPKKMQFVGIDTDVEVATQIYQYLEKMAEKLSKEQAHDKYSFRVGFGGAVTERFRQMVTERDTVMSNGTDLMIVKNDLIVQEFGAPNYRKCRINSRSQRDWERGKKAGENVALKPSNSGDYNTAIGYNKARIY